MAHGLVCNTLYGEAMSDVFGKQVQLSDNGQYMIVGAYLNDSEGDAAGKVYTYNLTTHTYSPYDLATSMPGEVSGEEFGQNVAMSGTGLVVAGSAPTSDVNGEDAGAVRTFQAAPSLAVNSLSTEIDTVSVMVQQNIASAAVPNAPPSLDISKDPVFQQQRFYVPPVGAVGALVSNFIDQSGPLSNYSDADGDAPGLAIVGANIGNGKLWFTTNNGDSWAAIGAVSTNSARVLFADSHTRLFYQSPDIQDDSDALNIQFKAWDRTGYSNGASGVDTTVSMAPDSVATYDFKEALLGLVDIGYGYGSMPATWPNASPYQTLGFAAPSQGLVDSEYQSESNLLITASRTAFSLYDTTDLQEPTQLSTYELFEGFNGSVLNNGSGYSVIAGVNICGPDVLVVEVHNVLVNDIQYHTFITSRTWLVFDIRSPDSPRLVQQFQGSDPYYPMSGWLQKKGNPVARQPECWVFPNAGGKSQQYISKSLMADLSFRV